jgi:predicted ATPase/DNA-binding CsgD family transcriptional regulator/transcriptional regulator with XRE-family HTH domain
MQHMTMREQSLFGSLLLRHRVAGRMTQEQLAAHAGLSVDAIAALERGKRRTPRGATVELLATALELNEHERAEFYATARLSATVAVDRISSDAEGDADVLPPTIGWRPTVQPTPLVGRRDELDTTCQRLAVEGVRLLTLTGPAGVGKTRLALAAVTTIARDLPARFSDGIAVVDLTFARDSEQVFDTIARTVGFKDDGSVPLRERLESYLRQRSSLLMMLDNFEQALSAASHIAQLLATCPGLQLLVTSRAPLRLRWEQTLRVAPLPVPNATDAPPSVEELITIPSVELFMSRARAHRADFTLTASTAPLVAQLVTQLDGLPLALKLAAARMDVMPLAALVRRQEDRLQLLRWDAQDLPDRHRSLEAALGWSYDLLTEYEQRIFRRLGVFVGQVTLEAIASVAGVKTGVDDTEGNVIAPDHRRSGNETLEILVSLAAKSLILPGQRNALSDEDEYEDDDQPEIAFTMLETVREYAREQLERLGELEAARRAHAYYFLTLAERADPQLRALEQRNWYLRLEREHDNLRAALRWLFDQETPEEREAALRLAAALGWFWVIRGYPVEGRRWLEKALSRLQMDVLGEGSHAALRLRTLLEAGSTLLLQGEFTQARVLQEQALALAQQWQDPTAIAQALTYLGTRAVYAGELAEGVRLLSEAQTRWETLGDPFFLGLTLNFLGTARLAQGDQEEAEKLKAAALELLEASGGIGFAGTARVALAAILAQRGDLPQAVRHVRSAIEASLALRDRRLISSGLRAALVFMDEQIQPEQRMRLLGASDALSQVTGGTVVRQQESAYPLIAALREHLERGEWAAAYRQGLSLSIGAVGSLALTLLDEVARRLASVNNSLDRPQQQGPSAILLSEREQEVLRLVAQGLSSKAIGQRLFLSPSTVNHHIQSIFNKLGVDTRAQAVAVAGRQGLL